ncbi:MAG: TRAP transporter large permease [Rhodospirillales bacterium]|jgi:tripartite ATP-independent transporter DctM subunit|nr:TRAP transporter large permease [Rhodospirillales bacterium]
MLYEALISIGILVVLLSFGVPLAFCFAGALMYLTTFSDVATMKSTMVWGFSQLGNPVLLCIPLFVFAGNLMSSSGIADALLRFMDLFVGRIRGGLGAVAVITCGVIGAISGSGLTGVAAVGGLLIPRMEAAGYPRGYSTALVASSSILGLLIPPSISMIIFGWVTETSILACFLATLVPGVLLMAVFIAINYVCARHFDVARGESIPLERIFREAKERTMKATPALMMPIIILGGIYGGVMTPTEAAAVACLYSIPVGLYVYKGLNQRKIVFAGKDSVTAVGSIMVMILFSLILSQQFVFGGVPQDMAEAIFSITSNEICLLLLVNVLLFIVGMMVNDVTGIILLAPLLLPLLKQIGVDPVHFAAIMGVNLGMGLLTPPYASVLYFSMRVGDATFVQVVRPLGLFLLLGYLPMCLLVTFYEPLSMALPRLLGYA